MGSTKSGILPKIDSIHSIIQPLIDLRESSLELELINRGGMICRKHFSGINPHTSRKARCHIRGRSAIVMRHCLLASSTSSTYSGYSVGYGYFGGGGEVWVLVVSAHSWHNLSLAKYTLGDIEL